MKQSPIYIESFDDRFQAFFRDEPVQILHSGMIWCEGPTYLPTEDLIIWSDIPNNIVWGWKNGGPAVPFLQPSNYANGHTIDSAGRLISCEHSTRRVTRREKNGRFTVIADQYRGQRLNSPNDVVCRRDGSIWFTDPPYGILSDHEGHRAKAEQPGHYVYRWDPSGKLDIVAGDFDKPNGLCFSPDETTLYISDTGASHNPNGPHHIRSFTVSDKHLNGGNVLIVMQPGLADGLRTDQDGNIWSSAGDGVHCYTDQGRLLGKIRTPSRTSNCCFAGRNRDQLVITATDYVYKIALVQKGWDVSHALRLE